MPHQLTFSAVHTYDGRLPGITLPVTLRSGTTEMLVDAKFDPGSTFCIFQPAIGRKLGFDIERGIYERIGTVTGSFSVYGHEVVLNVLGIETTATVYFAVDENFPVNVLGRVGWLDRVLLGLVDSECRLYLSDYNDPA